MAARILVPTLPKTNIAPLKMVVSNRNFLFQGLFSGGELLVSGRESWVVWHCSPCPSMSHRPSAQRCLAIHPTPWPPRIQRRHGLWSEWRIQRQGKQEQWRSGPWQTTSKGREQAVSGQGMGALEIIGDDVSKFWCDMLLCGNAMTIAPSNSLATQLFFNFTSSSLLVKSSIRFRSKKLISWDIMDMWNPRMVAKLIAPCCTRRRCPFCRRFRSSWGARVSVKMGVALGYSIMKRERESMWIIHHLCVAILSWLMFHVISFVYIERNTANCC